MSPLSVHHLSCGTLHPPSRRLVNGTGGLLTPATMVCHCLLVEAPDGLILIDTGLGTGAVHAPETWLGDGFTRMNRPVLDLEETALHQVRRLGFDSSDVTDILLTHLDRDHAGGISDFPHARIHVLEPELRSARSRSTTRARDRYLDVLWQHQPRWVPHDPTPNGLWFGMPAVRDLDGLPPQIRLVPLAGHTEGHTGIAIDVGDKSESRWILHAGDAYFHHREIDATHPRSTPGLAYFQRKVQADRAGRRASLARLRHLRATQPESVTIISAHDPVEYERLATG